MRRRGLTTVEVLVASAIVLVFLAVGSTRRHGRYWAGARRSACAERLHTLGAGLALYANDHDGWLPPATTVEWAYPKASAADLAASPALLRALVRPYVPKDEEWFCPLDPQQGRNVLWLGQRHLVSSYAFAPPLTEESAWPPKMQLGKVDVPLLSDAAGIPREGFRPAVPGRQRGGLEPSRRDGERAGAGSEPLEAARERVGRGEGLGVA